MGCVGLTNQDWRPLVLSLCGPSGSGKSQLAKALVAELGEMVCARIPTDYFLLPAEEPLTSYFAKPLRYDWPLLDAALALPLGTATSTPDFDFNTFQRRDVTDGLPFTIRPLMVTDAMVPYPCADAVVLVSVPDDVRRDRLVRRDAIWSTQVIDRWHNLELTRGELAAPDFRPDLKLSGEVALAENARRLAKWLRERFPDTLPS
jgi:uridine kinase